MDAGVSPLDRLMLAAYLGDGTARGILGSQAPDVFSLGSMLRGGDRPWRALMRELGHEPVAVAACDIAELALAAFIANSESGPEFATLARDAEAALGHWRNNPRSDKARAELQKDTLGFCIAVDVGGQLSSAAGESGRQFGRVLGMCASVVLGPENRRYVRWLGEAAQGTCRLLGVPEDEVCRTVSCALLPYILPVEPGDAECGGK
jgi:hypothetical protein